MPSLTVIIPVYNAEHTLDRCVESVRSQDCGALDLRIILVDDGSPDNCPKLCDDWAARDQRISVIHKTNGGLSRARNAGLDHCATDYVTFVDADDYLEGGTLRSVMREMQPDYDLLEYAVIRMTDKAQKGERLSWGRHAYTEADSYWFGTRGYAHSWACNKIYRRELFDGLRFTPDMLFEDMDIMPRLLRRCKRFGTTTAGAYVYTYNPQGITISQAAKGLPMLLDAHLRSGFTLRDDRYYMALVNIQLDVFPLTGRVLLPTRRDVQVKILSDNPTRLKALFITLFGLKTLCRLWSLFKR